MFGELRIGSEPACRLAARSTTVLVCMAMLACADAANADDVRRSGAEFVKQGNSLLADGKYQEALDAYDKAAEELPDSPVVAYNRGIALYRLSQFDKAEPAFQDALKTAQTELEARAKYNLGRCAHEAALAQKDNLPAAMNDLSRAIRFYQDALQINPNDLDAQKNKALAERLRLFLEKKLQEQQQQKQQPSSQPSSQPDQPSSQPDQSTSQPSSQPTSQPQDGEGQEQESQEQDQQQGKQGPKNKQQSADQESSDESKAAAEEGEKEADLQEVELMLQEAREAERQRRAAEREKALRIRGLGRVPKDW